MDNTRETELLAIIHEQQALIEQMAARIKQLEAQLAKHSGNSSKPPSSDGLRKKPASLREKGKRKMGGQKGHAGKTLKLSANPDHIEVHDIEACPKCGCAVDAVEASQVERRQVWDVPPLKLIVTEHQAPIKQCPCCQQRVQAPFPEGVTQAVQYGSQLMAQAAYLSNYQLIPLARVRELFEDWYGHAPSEAVILKASERVERQISPALAQIKALLKRAELVHSDETGLRVEGKLHWAHVVCHKELTYYEVDTKRGYAAWERTGILPEVLTRIVHDGWKPYWQLKGAQHALCNAHHLRDLRFIHEQYQQEWAEELAKLLVSALREVQSAPADQTSLPPERLEFYTQAYERLLRIGYAAQTDAPKRTAHKRGRAAQSAAKNLLDHLQQYQAQTLAFLSDFRVPFDNNLAERDLRMLKVKQKIAGCFRTFAGARTFCAIRSYLSTARKQGQRVLTALHDALLGQPFLPA